MVIDIFGLACTIWFLLVTCYTPSGFPTYFALSYTYFLIFTLSFLILSMFLFSEFVWVESDVQRLFCGTYVERKHFSFFLHFFGLFLRIFLSFCHHLFSHGVRFVYQSFHVQLTVSGFEGFSSSIPVMLALSDSSRCIFFLSFFCLSECLLTFSYSQIWWAAWRSSSKLAIADLDWCGKRGRASLYWDQMAGFAEPEPWTVDQIRSFSFSFGGTDWLRLAGIGIILL